MSKKKIPIYKYENGVLVRVPGDKRDPNKRYSSVSSPTEQYLIEFTEEEERQRDIEEAQWAADQPKRDAEVKKQKEEFEKFKNSLQYEDRYAVFLDILGWKSLIERSARDPELAKNLGISLKFIQSQIEMANFMPTPYDLQITHFSDSIFISTNSTYPLNVSPLLDTIRFIIQHFITMGFPVRGGITFGPLIHRNTMAYGPALNRAYEIENELAVYPRILIDKPVDESFQKGVPVYDQRKQLMGYTKLWRKDLDGCVFFDYLQSFMTMPGEETDLRLIKSVLEPAQALINNGLKQFKIINKIYVKYKWMANYYNAVLDEYPGIDLKKF